MIKKQKIIIISNNLATGGIQKALVNLLNELRNQYEITLFLFSDSGDYKNRTPNHLNIIKANSFLRLLGISQKESKNLGVLHYVLRAILVFWTRIFNNSLPIRFLLLTQAKLKKYDIAISFVHSPPDKEFYGGCNEFVLQRVDASRKCAFIHCDFLNYGGNSEKNRRIYNQFDCIATVSEGCKNHFLKALPELRNKTYTVQNCHDYLDILQKANSSPIQYESESFNIVTIARLSEEKGIVRTIKVINHLVNKGYKIRWHLIGEGIERNKIEESITEYRLEENIILYGNQKNPYKFMVNADLFLLPSFHEAAPMVFEEAKCVGLPILTTRTTSASEMVENTNSGWTCHNSSDGIKETLKYILDNRDEHSKIKENLKNKMFTNELALKQFNIMINGEDTNE